MITFPKPLTLIVGRNGSGKTVRSHLSARAPAPGPLMSQMRAQRPARACAVALLVGTSLGPPSLIRLTRHRAADHHRVPQARRHGRVAAQLARRQVLRARPKGTALGTLGGWSPPFRELTHPGPGACASQVYGADEVKAQIKLQCKTVTGKPFLVIRSFQLSRKRGKYEFKSLDQNIQISNNKGEVRCTWCGVRGVRVARVALTRPRGVHSAPVKLEGISKRCADINQEVPQLLGVSKACLSRRMCACRSLATHSGADCLLGAVRPSSRTSSSCTRTTPTGAFRSCTHVSYSPQSPDARVAGRWLRERC